jgi:hypothetical protein
MTRANPMLGLQDEEKDLHAPQPDAPEVMTTKPKVSVALPPRLYYQLVEFCAGAAKARGARVTHREVMMALVTELFSSEQLRKRVNEHLLEYAREQRRTRANEQKSK